MILNWKIKSQKFYFFRPLQNVVFVLTACEGKKTHKSLSRIGGVEIAIGSLDMWDKAEIVRDTLAKHRKSLNETGFGNQVCDNFTISEIVFVFVF